MLLTSALCYFEDDVRYERILASARQRVPIISKNFRIDSVQSGGWAENEVDILSFIWVAEWFEIFHLNTEAGLWNPIRDALVPSFF